MDHSQNRLKSTAMSALLGLSTAFTSLSIPEAKAQGKLQPAHISKIYNTVARDDQPEFQILVSKVGGGYRAVDIDVCDAQAVQNSQGRVGLVTSTAYIYAHNDPGMKDTPKVEVLKNQRNTDVKLRKDGLDHIMVAHKVKKEEIFEGIEFTKLYHVATHNRSVIDKAAVQRKFGQLPNPARNSCVPFINAK